MRNRDVDALVGSRIWEARKKRDLTRKALAKLVNAKIDEIAEIENGQMRARSEILIKIVRVIGISSLSLFAPNYDDQFRDLSN